MWEVKNLDLPGHAFNVLPHLYHPYLLRDQRTSTRSRTRNLKSGMFILEPFNGFKQKESLNSASSTDGVCTLTQRAAARVD
jgi:hypothetical protein